MNSLYVSEIQIHPDRLSPDSYIQNIPALTNLSSLSFHSSVTIFSGENGSGKSTLMEAMAIAAGFNPEGGSRNYCFSTYDSHSELFQALTLIKRRPIRWGYFLRAESFYNVASRETEYADPAHPSREYHKRSHGESFLRLAQDTFSTDGLYFLDEPEAALSPQRQLTLLSEIVRCASGGAQFFIATHSPILLGIPNAEILQFNDHIEPVDYEETENVQIMRLFLDNRERLLKELLEEEQ